MFKCDVCEFETDVREKYAGHRSGHVRRGDLSKKIKNSKHQCKECKKTFETGMALGGHVRYHDHHISNLKSSGSKKIRMIKEYGHQCTKCKLSTWLGLPIPLTIDHIDGDSSNGDETNLQILCPNCHAQTPTFCGKNMGKFPGGERYSYMKKWRKKLSENISVG